MCGVGKSQKTLKNRIWLFLFLLVWCAQILTAVYFCCQKKGFHEDEYYTYYATARTYGLMIEDGAWMERDTYFNEFVVLEGQQFQYGLVKLVQSWDVHPPVYYWIFHTVSSLFPGQFSKWFGLVINLAAYGVSMFLLRMLALQLTRHNEKLALLVCLFYGFTPAVMSGVVFIRMYALLTVFVYLCAILHMNVVQKINTMQKLPVKTFLLPLAVVTYLGFLTQYYYFIFLFFMAAAFCIYLLWRERKLWNCIRYGLTVAATFFGAWLTYPSCLGQMFRGQRGAQATDNFFDMSNTLIRIDFFWRLLDEYVFCGLLSVFLLVGLLLVLYVVYQSRRKRLISLKESGERNSAYFILLAAVIGYFLAVAKTALLLGNTSVRYQMPVYGMIVLLLFVMLEELLHACGSHIKIHLGDRAKNALFAIAAVVCLVISLAGLCSGRVVFLYPEDEERTAFAEKEAKRGTPVVCLYDVGQSWCVWDSADEFFAYDRIYFARTDNTDMISDDIIRSADDLVVYLSNSGNAESQLQRIFAGNENLSTYELQYQEKYCDVYYLH